MENENPGWRLAEQPRRVEKVGGESVTISPETVELLRGAVIPAEFFKVTQEFFPRTDQLHPIDRESFVTSADIEAPVKERPMFEMPNVSGLAAPTEPWQEELREPDLETPDETQWEDVPWKEPEMLPEPPGDFRTEGGGETFYMTELKLDLSRISHMTQGLLEWEGVPLERIVADTYPVLFDEEDGDRAPGDDPRENGEELPDILPTCHCQGGRLAIVIGDSDDGAIRGALNWVATTSLAHLHKVYFAARLNDTFSLFQPRIFREDAGRRTWKKFLGRDPIVELVKTYQDCCYYEEVVIFAHGSQRGLYRGLAELMPRFLDRPVKKLVFWVCGSDRESFPFTDDNKRADFESICYLVRPPPSCPCGCDHKKCTAQTANGARTRCPDRTTRTEVLSAGYYRSEGQNWPSALGLDPAHHQPFNAPDARMIRTTVTALGENGKAVRLNPVAVEDADVFGSPVRSYEGLKKRPSKAPIMKGFNLNVIKEAEVPNGTPKEIKKLEDKFGKLADYRGPRRDPARCPAADGCLH
ncbi:MAG: hypothetical protein OEN50_01125 [Deltaproteobacteria bacterium]|nr:hypothetical protein [Deltaproteobacteria bacterium]